ncbi:dihydroxyacetone kinase phosphoryl donor subunit DhaM [Streptococcus equi]|uniref:dihydroxyacetone kinase phosphoryl donor subunit DhaM n=1 Tax=Streptococcus equi TaxID=1336 RepID=UPI0013F5E93F|nr:dihydroxyacetone kinase phosphoryl donor subunit DhaM [Streptococcus equi]
MNNLGIVIVSHSKYLAQGIIDLIGEVAKDVPITYIGGTSDGGIGSSFDSVQKIVELNQAKELLAFYDLGSARMNLELVDDFTAKTLLVQNVPIVEGAYIAAALLQAGADKDSILTQLDELTITK